MCGCKIFWLVVLQSHGPPYRRGQQPEACPPDLERGEGGQRGERGVGGSGTRGVGESKGGRQRDKKKAG